jgi:hypothetical protein
MIDPADRNDRAFDDANFIDAHVIGLRQQFAATTLQYNSAAQSLARVRGAVDLIIADGPDAARRRLGDQGFNELIVALARWADAYWCRREHEQALMDLATHGIG